MGDLHFPNPVVVANQAGVIEYDHILEDSAKHTWSLVNMDWIQKGIEQFQCERGWPAMLAGEASLTLWTLAVSQCVYRAWESGGESRECDSRTVTFREVDPTHLGICSSVWMGEHMQGGSCHVRILKCLSNIEEIPDVKAQVERTLIGHCRVTYY